MGVCMLHWLAELLGEKSREKLLLKSIKDFYKIYEEYSLNKYSEIKLIELIRKIENRINNKKYLEQSKQLQKHLYILRRLLAENMYEFHNALFVAALKIRNELANFEPKNTNNYTPIFLNQITPNNDTDTTLSSTVAATQPPLILNAFGSHRVEMLSSRQQEDNNNESSWTDCLLHCIMC